MLFPTLSVAGDTDSLWKVYNDVNTPIETRLAALDDMSFKMIFRNPDSADVLANILLQSAIDNDNPGMQAAAYKTLGISAKKRSEYISSINFYDKGIKIAEENDLQEILSKILVNKAMSYRSMGDFAKAEETNKEAIAIQEKYGYLSILKNSYNNLGVVYIIQDNIPLSLEYFQKALKISEQLNDSNWIAAGTQNIGLVYFDQGENEMALGYLKKSLALYRLLDDVELQGNSLNNMGLIYKNLDSLDKALACYNEGLQISIDHNFKENQAAIYINKANIFRLKGEYQPAIDNFEKSLHISSPLGNKVLMTEALNGLGTIKNQQSQFSIGKKYCEEAYTISNDIGYLEELKNSCGCLKDSYEGLGEYRKAFSYFKKYHVLIDSIAKMENEDEVIKMTMRYEFEKQQFADSLVMVEDKLKTELAHQKELDAEKNRRNLLLSGGFVIILIAAGLLGSLFLVRRTNKTLAQKNQIIEHEKLRAEQSEKAKEKFFDNISHEFKTPLTLIIGPIEELNNNIDDEALKPKLDILDRNARRLQFMINELLSLSKLESGKERLLASEENIVSLTRDYLSSFESIAEQKKIRLSFEATPDDLQVFTDIEKIKRVLSNLLSNAFKFTPEGGQITVSVEKVSAFSNQNREGALIKIADTGIGIDKENLDHIFDRFYQVDSSHRRTHQGAGIGLALTKEIVELHTGSINALSEPGKGTTFEVFLPFGREHLDDDQLIEDKTEIAIHGSDADVNIITKQETADNDKVKTITEELPRLLIVEDNEDMRTYIKSYLDTTYKIYEAADGEEGYLKATELIPDLIISDVMMPMMDGNEMTLKIKNDIRTSHVPLILLTARSSVDSKIEGLETGADDYLTKPFNARELKVRINNLIVQRKKLKELFSQFAGDTNQKMFTTSASSGLKPKDEQFINKALQVVETHISTSEFDVETFATEMALSRVQLHRKIKGITDQSARDFIRTVRLKHAARLLLEGSGNVTQVAYEVGFTNLSWFTKIFRDQFGVSPSDFIKNTN